MKNWISKALSLLTKANSHFTKHFNNRLDKWRQTTILLINCQHYQTLYRDKARLPESDLLNKKTILLCHDWLSSKQCLVDSVYPSG